MWMIGIEQSILHARKPNYFAMEWINAIPCYMLHLFPGSWPLLVDMAFANYSFNSIVPAATNYINSSNECVNLILQSIKFWVTQILGNSSKTSHAVAMLRISPSICLSTSWQLKIRWIGSSNEICLYPNVWPYLHITAPWTYV